MDLPEHLQPLKQGEVFNFSCHKDVSCFTECCRMLNLQLTPYDMLRLRRATGKNSSAVLEQYVIEEQQPGEPFPQFYLTMIDDGRASCVFVSPKGCTIYANRPSACRTYPVGRGASRERDKSIREQFILLKEPHCKGFREKEEFTPESYMTNQELETYNAFNDALLPLLQHPAIQQGFVPSGKQKELFTLALYNIDSFREHIVAKTFDSINAAEQKRHSTSSDEELLLFAIHWLQKELFSFIR